MKKTAKSVLIVIALLVLVAPYVVLAVALPNVENNLSDLVFFGLVINIFTGLAYSVLSVVAMSVCEWVEDF